MKFRNVRPVKGHRVRQRARVATSSSAAVLLAVAFTPASAEAQLRTLGVDVSYWQGEITQTNWNSAYTTDNLRFAFIRSTRGGTTGLGQTSGTPAPHTSQETLSRRYDDSRFFQNMNRASNAGFMVSAYHFARPDIPGNTGTDEANHFMQMAGPWMRPGYMQPMYDLEAGQGQTTPDQLAQFSLDFSNRIYNVMKIRPSIYFNGNYANDLAGASATLRNQLAQPSSNGPSVVNPAYATTVYARYPAGSGNEYLGNIQAENPRDAGSSLSWFYGPWDDYGTEHPWTFWQFGSGEKYTGWADQGVDGDVAHGDIEYVRNYLVPAVWWNDSNGDWSTMANWNSGQPVVAPVVGAGQAAPFSAAVLPTPRLPGAAGSGPASGQYDTVILERPDANITVSVTTGSHNVRKLYMRETLNISGGSLTVNYNPTYRADVNNTVVLHGGPISAQFSGDVTVSGTGALSVHTLLVDATRNFNLAGGTVTLNNVLLTRGATPAKINVTGNVTLAPLSNTAATIGNIGSGNTALIDLSGGARTLTINNGSAATDLTVNVPITNGALVKAGAGTMLLTAANTYAGGTTVNAGTLTVTGASGLGSTSGPLAVNNPNGGVATNVVLNLSTTSPTTTGSLSGSIANASAGTNTATINNGGQLLTVKQTVDAAFAGAIAGAGGFTLGAGSTHMLTLLNEANTYSGATTINGGVLNATAFDDAGSPSSIGTGASGSLVLSGGTLRYASEPNQSTNRSFTLGIGASAGTIDSSSPINAGLEFRNAGAIGFTGSGARTLTLAGSSTGANKLAGVIGNGTGGATTVAKAGAGIWTLSGNNAFTGGVNATGGTLIVAHPSALGSGPLSMSNALVRLQANLAETPAIHSVSTTGAGALDITDNMAVIKQSNGTTVRNLIVSGFASGAWNGPGIHSSIAAADFTTGDKVQAIGYVDAAQLPVGTTSFAGITGLDANDVIIKHTYYGDADLSGTVDLDDFTQLLAGVAGDGTGWLYGDFDYNGNINLDDFTQFLAGFNFNGAPLSEMEQMVLNADLTQSVETAMLSAIAAVPEPSGLAALATAACGFAVRRRRRNGST